MLIEGPKKMDDFLASRMTIEARRICENDMRFVGVAEPFVRLDSRIASPDRSKFVPPHFLKKTASDDSYKEFHAILDELFELNRWNAGLRIREIEVLLHYEGIVTD